MASPVGHRLRTISIGTPVRVQAPTSSYFEAIYKLKVSTLRLHTPGLKSNVTQVIESLISYAEQHKARRVHDMDFPDFCKLTGFPLGTATEEIVKIMSQTRKATASINVIETSRTKNKTLLAGSWPVFNFILIRNAEISFEICEYMWEDLPSREWQTR